MQKHHLTTSGLLSSVILCALKLWAGILSGSIAVISDALNSLLDVFSYTALHLSVIVQERAPDADHHFGHRRAEPLAGFLIAILAAILGSMIIKDAFLSLFTVQKAVHQGEWQALFVLTVSILVKGILAFLYRQNWKQTQSPAVLASFVDSRNDALTSLVAFIGVVFGNLWDSVAGLCIGLWILYSGGKVGLENLGYLMGKAPPAEILALIRKEALAVPGVTGVNDLRAHFVGDLLHIEIHIEIDERRTLKEAHDIGVTVRQRLEALPHVDKAFIHIDPI
ncbi:MAG: cation transporter [Nitrospinota bacterium]|nr:MAG: cation transporter [Nitrospinota bacterium]